jgi:hypothetical protein
VTKTGHLEPSVDAFEADRRFETVLQPRAGAKGKGQRG